MGDFSQNSLWANIFRNGFTFSNRYEVEIYGYNNDVPDSKYEVMLNCCNFNIPGVNIGFMRDGKRYGVGMEKSLPTNKNFTDINMTFYESKKESERRYFIEWQDKIFDRESKRMNFYYSYVKDIHIKQYSKDNQLVYAAIAKEAWPTNISPMDRSYASGDQIPQFNVSLQIYDLQETFY